VSGFWSGRCLAEFESLRANAVAQLPRLGTTLKTEVLGRLDLVSTGGSAISRWVSLGLRSTEQRA